MPRLLGHLSSPFRTRKHFRTGPLSKGVLRHQCTISEICPNSSSAWLAHSRKSIFVTSRDIDGKEEVDDELGNPRPRACWAPRPPLAPALETVHAEREHVRVKPLPKAAGRSTPAQPEPGRPLPQAGPLRPRLLSPRRGCQEFESQRLRVHFWSHCPQRHLTGSRVCSRSLLAS